MIEPGQQPGGEQERTPDPEAIEDLQPREEESAELKAGKIVFGPSEHPRQ